MKVLSFILLRWTRLLEHSGRGSRSKARSMCSLNALHYSYDLMFLCCCAFVLYII